MTSIEDKNTDEISQTREYAIVLLSSNPSILKTLSMSLPLETL